jgi:four helix bundle protein
MPVGVRDLFHFTFCAAENFTMHIISHFPAENISQRAGRCAMAESKLRDLSMDFAVKTIKLCETIKGHYSLVNQLERAATSIGANIREANYAHGKADFTAKLQIALKECYETEYWLELFVKAEICERDAVVGLYTQCGTIRRILIASINTAKQNT